MDNSCNMMVVEIEVFVYVDSFGLICDYTPKVLGKPTLRLNRFITLDVPDVPIVGIHNQESNLFLEARIPIRHKQNKIVYDLQCHNRVFLLIHNRCLPSLEAIIHPMYACINPLQALHLD